MKQKVVAVCPADANNDVFFHQMENSLRKFHTVDELPLIRTTTNGDPNYFYKACPYEASQWLLEYKTVIKLDADQIICGPLNEIWEGEFDVGVVYNDPNYPIQVWDINPYFNMGLVVMKNLQFVDHWLRLCNSPHFNNYQFREQDLLSILASDYFNYKVRCLDDLTKGVYGEWAKPFWSQTKLKGDDIIIELPEGEIKLNVIHFGGGANDPSKGNYRIRFPEPVVKRIEELIK